VDFVGVDGCRAGWIAIALDESGGHSHLVTPGIAEVARRHPEVQQAAARYHKPIIITENGVADGHDAFRKWWIMETLEVLREAQKTGVNLHGYLHWSLLDNFEWAYGWWPRFGLIAVDRAHNMQRSVRPSAAWLATWLAGSGQSLQKR